MIAFLTTIFNRRYSVDGVQLKITTYSTTPVSSSTIYFVAVAVGAGDDGIADDDAAADGDSDGGSEKKLLKFHFSSYN